ncbi:cytochrome c oxidase subunit 3 family protein [Palleronia sediminis]|uniref:Cytochrome c oxidase subunit 3 family protein n=1 Tax=Palleronia sediminis TaxID=2547833 RepID=A0A4R6A1M9_9RHOB|nr:cytochrome c oxidase subunit 3 [Palleronia sediminis]TDL76327.1 cytochrome c oxidase subunit 3 family protein [Palleronia sediminis]
MRQPHASDELPGELLMWILIVSELAVFAAGLAVFLSVRITDPEGFAQAQDMLDRRAAGINTVVLITSGFLAAMAYRMRQLGQRGKARLLLISAALLGVLFLWIKGAEFASKSAAGIVWDTHPFFNFYFLLTGFHAAHVAAGVVLLPLVAWRDTVENIEDATAFWHMVDLVWVLLFPVIYLLR